MSGGLHLMSNGNERVNWLKKSTCTEQNALLLLGTDEKLPTTRDLLQFWTGDNSLSLAGEQKLSVEILVDSTKPLPESRACFQCLQLPSCHKDFESFKEAMDTALLYGSQGYGKF